MKKTTLICTLVAIVAFGAGYLTCQKVSKNNIESSNFKRELIEAQALTIERAEYILNKHNIWDKDGSDEMMEYMEYYEKVDSLYTSQL